MAGDGTRARPGERSGGNRSPSSRVARTTEIAPETATVGGSRVAPFSGSPAALLGIQRVAGNVAARSLIGMEPAAPLQRSAAGEMSSAADQDEKELAEQQTRKPEGVATLSLIYDVGQAHQLHSELVVTRPKLAEGLSAGELFVKQTQWDANEHAIEMLESYLGDAGTQSGVLGDFQVQFDELQRDGTRLKSEMDSYAATKQGLGTEDSSDSTEVAQAEIKSTGRTTGQLQAGFRKAVTSATGSSNTATHEDHAAAFKLDMQKASARVVETEGLKIAAESDSKAKAEQLHSRIVGQTIDADKEKIEALKEKAAEAKENIALIGDFVKTATELGTAPELAAGEIAKAGVDTVFKIAEYVAAHHYDDDIDEIKKQLRSLKADKEITDLMASVDEAKAAKDKYVVSAQSYIDANKSLSDVQKEYRNKMQEMGASADAATGGGSRYEVIAELLSEGEAYLARSDAAIKIAEREVDKSHETAKKQEELKNMQGGHELGVPYYRADRWYTRQTLSWQATGPYYFHLHSGDDTGIGHAEGEKFGADPVMARVMEQLHADREQVQKYVEVLQKVFSAKAPK